MLSAAAPSHNGVASAGAVLAAIKPHTHQVLQVLTSVLNAEAGSAEVLGETDMIFHITACDLTVLWL